MKLLITSYSLFASAYARNLNLCSSPPCVDLKFTNDQLPRPDSWDQFNPLDGSLLSLDAFDGEVASSVEVKSPGLPKFNCDVYYKGQKTVTPLLDNDNNYRKFQTPATLKDIQVMCVPAPHT